MGKKMEESVRRQSALAHSGVQCREWPLSLVCTLWPFAMQVELKCYLRMRVLSVGAFGSKLLRAK